MVMVLGLLKMEVSELMRAAHVSDSFRPRSPGPEEVCALVRMFTPLPFLMAHLQTGVQGCLRIKVFLPSGISSTSSIA